MIGIIDRLIATFCRVPYTKVVGEVSSGRQRAETGMGYRSAGGDGESCCELTSGGTRCRIVPSRNGRGLIVRSRDRFRVLTRRPGTRCRAGRTRFLSPTDPIRAERLPYGDGRAPNRRVSGARFVMAAMLGVLLSTSSVIAQSPPLYYETDGSGPAVVFIAEWGHDTSSWFRILPALRPGHRLVRYDLRGQGRSGAAAGGDYSLEAHREDLLRLLDGLEIERAHLVASGLGARVAIAFAAEAPARVASIALLNPNLAWTVAERGWWARFLSAFARIGEPSLGEYTALLTEHWFGSLFVNREPWVEPFYDLMLRRQSPETLVAGLREWLSTDLVLDATSASTVPALVLTGGRDGQLVGEVRLRSAFPRLDRVVLAGSGHVPQLDDPAGVGSALNEHLARSVGPRIQR